MQLGLIGLGRMGANMATRLAQAGHEIHVYDAHADTVRQLVAKGATGADSLEGLVRGLTAPCVDAPLNARDLSFGSGMWSGAFVCPAS